MEGCWFRCRLLCWLVAVLLLPKNICGAGDNQILIIVAMDGFKADYLNYSLTPNLQSVRRNGISVPFMRNAFPTKTFPNHFSIATGLYPEHHGVVSSELYDIKIGGLQYGYDMFHLDETITPIWVRRSLNRKENISSCSTSIADVERTSRRSFGMHDVPGHKLPVSWKELYVHRIIEYDRVIRFSDWKGA